MESSLANMLLENVPPYVVSQQHWCPVSERYAPAEALLQYLHEGWEPDRFVTVEAIYFAHGRRSEIYHLTLRRASSSIEMPVLANPVIGRIVSMCPALVVCHVEPGKMRSRNRPRTVFDVSVSQGQLCAIP
jgi:hypothetical protein